MSEISNRKDQHNPENSISIYLKKFQITDLNKMQKESLKTISDKKDVVLLSPTGSGKTLAFLLPLIEQLDKKIQEVQEFFSSLKRSIVSTING